MLTLFLVWIAVSGTITAAACISIARFQRHSGLLSNPKYYPEETALKGATWDDPLAQIKECDEFLKNGEPLDPAEFVPDGVHPTIAARHRTRIEGIRYTTRRVFKEVA